MRHYKYGLAETYLNYSDGDPERAALRAIAAEIRVVLPEREPIFVLHYDPGIYMYAERPCAGRFTYPRTAEQAEEMVGVLEAGAAGTIIRPAR